MKTRHQENLSQWYKTNKIRKYKKRATDPNATTFERRVAINKLKQLESK